MSLTTRIRLALSTTTEPSTPAYDDSFNVLWNI